jgi:hypothetical protein
MDGSQKEAAGGTRAPTSDLAAAAAGLARSVYFLLQKFKV